MPEEIRSYLFLSSLIFLFWYGTGRTFNHFEWKTTNYRGSSIPFSLGVLLLLCTGWYMIYWDFPDKCLFAVYIASVWTAGWIDDVKGEVHPKGIKGHFLFLWREKKGTTGILKIIIILLVSLTAASFVSEPIMLLPSFFIFALSPHVCNLLDTRPLRVWKWTLVHGILFLFFQGEFSWDVVLFVGVVMGVWAGLEGAEKSMLGDNGAALIGGIIAWISVSAMPLYAEIIVIAGYVVITVAAEQLSIHQLIEKRPFLYWVDQAGWKK